MRSPIAARRAAGLARAVEVSGSVARVPMSLAVSMLMPTKWKCIEEGRRFVGTPVLLGWDLGLIERKEPCVSSQGSVKVAERPRLFRFRPLGCYDVF